MRRRVLVALLALGTATGSIVLACGQPEQTVQTVDETTVVGAMELPISLSSQAPAPAGAVRIAISPTELHLDGVKVLDLERGRVPAAEAPANVITKLQSGIRAAPARSSAARRIHAVVPYQTMLQVLSTLSHAGLRDASLAVRRDASGGGEGWMRLPRYRVVPHDQEPVAFEGQRAPWSSFVEHWGEVYEACRAGQYVDCDNVALNPAVGGELQVVLWTREQAMKVTFRQVNAPEQPAPGTGPSGPALIDGLRAPPPRAEEEDRGPPSTEGAFTVRHQESTASPSAISNLVRPVCGQQACQAVIELDSGTASMRAVSFIGAAFPNGATAPELAFRIPEE